MQAAQNRIAAAAGLVLLAMALLGLIDNFVRLIAAQGGLWQFHLVRALIALPVLLTAALALRLRLRPLRPWPVILRSVFNGTAMLFYFAALALLPLGQAVAGLFTAPIFVLVISTLAFGERIGPWRVVAVALGFAGILLILRPSAAGLSPVSLVPVAAGACYAMSNIATRRWCAGESTATLLAGYFLVLGAYGALGLAVLALFGPQAAPGAAGFALRGWVAPDAAFLSWTAVQALGSLAGVGLVIRGYQIAEAGQVAVLEYALLFFATLWAWAIWGEVPDAVSVAGMACIVLAGVTIVLRSQRGGA
jgi:drug/metabolite transporter (DMT)-like permease